ncbi:MULTISPECIES: DUF4268 domain-containing protein [Rhizobium]|uniref:DUF4268 domain-containing protein n=1 Tax=Rhizobium TaxID=379 RepID=UPI0007EA841D|nr:MULTISPECIES: DUF4268 domain-containing protein [Rhizobium]ANK90555.1 hypothetical protein AMK01_CH01046 [Rhizobium sp. N6212]ANK96583.1 hypothetical protein AMK00_CH01047 [Rhizobium sp. N621]ANL02625.1 hypothetical protein AMJ99_CH01037 [Rhizobium esperanzae]ANL08754.1 hypothetical protein AMJ98_CH01038 [Rhizobium sp. N1341]ANL20801.1 hypothetical protein AMJ96_CH01040 [Rhizobium sp. N113]
MFRVDRSQNRIARLAQRRFGELALRERDHLQEWLVHQPDALGEELLIIQKEFDGFDETRERLDLLALDKAGNLVVIENKLDDSGRDVTWQALKYTAYVSGLNKLQIIEIYQQYLDRYCGGGSAAERVCEFMEVDELQETVLNPGNGQRMMFIAANFRREVTATVLWLLSRGIRAQCFRVVPYSFGDELFIDLQQIIPTPEAADYMIGISSKEVEETNAQGVQARRHQLRLQFWARALERLRADGITLFANVNPSRDHWLNAGSGVGGCPFTMVFARDEVRVEVNLARADRDQNKWLFDRLEADKSAIEAKFGGEMSWSRLDEKKQSRISYSHPLDGFDVDNWPEMLTWLSEHIRKLEGAFRQPLAQYARSIPSVEETTE